MQLETTLKEKIFTIRYPSLKLVRNNFSSASPNKILIYFFTARIIYQNMICDDRSVYVPSLMLISNPRNFVSAGHSPLSIAQPVLEANRSSRETDRRYGLVGIPCRHIFREPWHRIYPGLLSKVLSIFIKF